MPVIKGVVKMVVKAISKPKCLPGLNSQLSSIELRVTVFCYLLKRHL